MRISKVQVIFGVFVIAILLVCLILVISLTVRPSPQPQTVFAQVPTGESVEQLPTITVTGIGEIMVVPDTATVSFAVNTTDVDPAVALEENNRIMERVIAAIEAFDVDEADIQTSNFSIHPNYSWADHMSVLVDHTASNSLRVTVRDIDLVGEMIGAATAAGATSVRDVQFSSSDSGDAHSQALALAIESAAEKAEIMAQAAGRNIVGVLSVTEHVRWDTPATRGVFDASPMMEFAAFADRAFEVPVQLGEISVRAQVEMIYVIR